jgi:hypothetical protein
MSVETRRAEREDKTQTEKLLQAEKTKKGLASAVDLTTDFIPGVSETKDIISLGQNVGRGDYLAAGVDATALALGAVPIVGDVARQGLKNLAKNFIKTKKGNTDLSTQDALKQTDKDIENWKAKNQTSPEFQKRLKGRNDTLQEMAQGLSDKVVTKKEYREAVDAIRPIRTVKEVPKPASFKDTLSALDSRQRKNPIVGVNYNIPEGDKISARLDITAYTQYDTWIPTLKHEGKTMYKPSIVLKDVTFIKPDSSQVEKALKVATGKPKAPFAVMEGSYVDADNSSAYKYAKKIFEDEDVVQVGYDPTRRGYFYDRKTGNPIIEAEEVVQVGHLVLAKKAKMGNADDFFYSEGGDVVTKNKDKVDKPKKRPSNQMEMFTYLKDNPDVKGMKEIEMDRMRGIETDQDPRASTNTEGTNNEEIRERVLKHEELLRDIDKYREGKMKAAIGGTPMKKNTQAEQMEMFGDIGKMAKNPMPTDPVSGNEIPKGSVAEEVRDDIPAQLSEGEFVLPADVVRYHGLEKIMKLRQQAKSGINMMDDMGQMGNSEEATMPDDLPFNPKMAVGGAIPGQAVGIQQPQVAQPTVLPQQQPVQGVNVNPAQNPALRQSIYARPQPIGFPIDRPFDPPIYIGGPAPIVGLPSRGVGYKQPTDTASTPGYQDLIGAPYGQLQQSETRKYVNPETGEELYIPFVNGEPLYPIPNGYKYTEVIGKEKEPEPEDVVDTSVKTTQVSDSGGDDRQEPDTNEYRIASTLAKQEGSGIGGAIGELAKFIAAPGISIATAITDAITGKPKTEPKTIADLPADALPSARPESLQEVVRESKARELGYSSYGALKSDIGVDASFRFGTKPGDISRNTGKFFTNYGQSENTNTGEVAYSSFADFTKAMAASAKSGYYGGVQSAKDALARNPNNAKAKSFLDAMNVSYETSTGTGTTTTTKDMVKDLTKTYGAGEFGTTTPQDIQREKERRENEQRAKDEQARRDAEDLANRIAADKARAEQAKKQKEEEERAKNEQRAKDEQARRDAQDLANRRAADKARAEAARKQRERENDSGNDGGSDGPDGATSDSHICTATYNNGYIDKEHFTTLRKYGIMLRKTDPYMMKAYDMFGPMLA